MRRAPAERRPIGRGTAVLLAPVLAFTLVQGVMAQSDGREPRLEIETRPHKIEVGDRVEAEIVLWVPAGLAVGPPLFPEWGETWGEAEIFAVEPVASGGPAGTDGGERWTQVVTFALYRTGEVVLPPVTLEVPTAGEVVQVTSAEPIALTVSSVLPEGVEEPAPKPPAPPLPLPVGERFWWTLGIASALCLAAAGLLLSRRLRATAAAAAEAVDPATALREALARLAGESDPTALVAGLSLELRRYLGRRLGFPAAESTTTEIRRGLQERGVPAALVVPADALLRRCDAIKFARQPVELAACARHLEAAAEIAAGLEGHLRPAPEAEIDRREAA